jgi:diguanylate cyclase (GGDEF)-like protein
MYDIPGEQCFRFIADLLASVKSTNQSEKVLSLTVDRIVRMYRCRSCAVVLIDPSTEYLTIQSSEGISLTYSKSFRRMIATEAVGRLIWTGRPVLIRDPEVDPGLTQQMQLEHPFKSCAAVQISVDERPLGYLFMDSDRAEAFEERDVQKLQVFADIVGIGIIKDRLFEENLRLERVDKETGLEKYLPFLERLQASVARAQEVHGRVGVVLLDVDNFKQIVNTFGFDRSRQLLREMADVVRARLHAPDSVARFGFDEFILLLENTDLDVALDRANSLREELAAHPYTTAGVRSTVSMGVASFPQNGLSAEDLLTTARRALYEAQRAGRNTVHHFTREWYARETTV